MRGGVGVWLFWQWGGHLCVTPCELKGACEGWGFLFLLAVERCSVCSSLRGVRCVGVCFLVLSAAEGCLCIAPNEW